MQYVWISQTKCWAKEARHNRPFGSFFIRCKDRRSKYTVLEKRTVVTLWEGLGPGKHHHLSSEILVIYPHTLPSFPSSFFLFYISMVFLVCSQVCAYPVITTVNFRTFSSLGKETPCPLAITPSIALSNHQYIFYRYRYTYSGPFVYMESYTMGPFMSGFTWWASGFPGSCCAPWNRCCLPDFVKIVWAVHYILHIPMHIGYFNNKSQTIKIKHKVQRACSSSVHLRLLFLKMLVLPILLHVAGLGEVPSQSPSPTEDNGRWWGLLIAFWPFPFLTPPPTSCHAQLWTSPLLEHFHHLEKKPHVLWLSPHP